MARTIPATEVETPPNQTLQYIIYFIFGVVEVFLLFRLIFKLTGANPGSLFVSLIYTISKLFVFPFEGIFPSGYTQGVVTTSIFEPSSVVAMIVYAFLAWGIVQLAVILSGKKEA